MVAAFRLAHQAANGTPWRASTSNTATPPGHRAGLPATTRAGGGGAGRRLCQPAAARQGARNLACSPSAQAQATRWPLGSLAHSMRGSRAIALPEGGRPWVPPPAGRALPWKLERVFSILPGRKALSSPGLPSCCSGAIPCLRCRPTVRLRKGQLVLGRRLGGGGGAAGGAGGCRGGGGGGWWAPRCWGGSGGGRVGRGRLLTAGVSGVGASLSRGGGKRARIGLDRRPARVSNQRHEGQDAPTPPGEASREARSGSERVVAPRRWRLASARGR